MANYALGPNGDRNAEAVCERRIGQGSRFAPRNASGNQRHACGIEKVVLSRAARRRRGLNGRIWLGLAGQRDDLDAMAGQPFLRKLVLRIPRAFWPAPRNYGHVLAFTEAGKVVADLQDPSGASPVTTGATETIDRLYIQNVNGNSVAWLPSSAAVP